MFNLYRINPFTGGRAILVGIAAVLVMISGLSCFDDPQKPKKDQPRVPSYQNLTEKDHVLNNLELCYNDRDIVQYTRLLDDPNFIYYFSEADFASGATPEQWDRATDIERQGKMFDTNYQGQFKVISIYLKLEYPGGWIATLPDQGQYPGETWYYKSVNYDLKVEVQAVPENMTFLAQGLKALFTIRQSEFEGTQKWRIVEWRDDIDI